MSQPMTTLREKIALLIDASRVLRNGEMIIAPDQAAVAILAAVIEHATSDEAQKRIRKAHIAGLTQPEGMYVFYESIIRAAIGGE